MHTITPIAKLGLLGLVGLLTWVAAPAASFAHDRDHREHRRGHHGQGAGDGWRRPAVQVHVAPRAYHRAPSPRHVWVPGFWGWRAHRRVWVEAAWTVPPQPAMVWVAPNWVWDGHARRWVWQEGHWAPGGPR